MPICSGYSIEKQMTDKEDVGGLQLEIIPSTSELQMKWGKNRLSFSRHPNVNGTMFNYPVRSEIFVEQVGNGSGFMAVVPQGHTYLLLRELVVQMQPQGSYRLKVLHEMKLKITVQYRRF